MIPVFAGGRVVPQPKCGNVYRVYCVKAFQLRGWVIHDRSRQLRVGNDEGAGHGFSALDKVRIVKITQKNLDLRLRYNRIETNSL